MFRGWLSRYWRVSNAALPAASALIRLTLRKPILFRFVLVMLLSAWVGAGALAASPGIGSDDKTALPAILETPDQVFLEVLRQSIGAPARADIDDQATARLSDGLVIVPEAQAARLLTVMARPVPSDFKGLLLGSEGMEAAGIIRFIPSGFIDSDAALAWTPEDMLASLNDTVLRGNAERLTHNLQEREARQWVQPPRYDPETHQLSWAALILPKTAARESDGEFTYHAIGFGREGYVHLTIVTSVQKAGEIGRMADAFRLGLYFRPGKAYGDAVPTDRRAPNGLAGAMEIDSLHKVRSEIGFWGPDIVIPVAGGIVATIGALSLLLYIQRHLRRESRRG